MTKKEVQQRVSKNGKPLPLSDFEWDEKTNTFSSEENYLVLDFNGVNGCTFDTGSNCTFDTGSACTFKTGDDCTFDTGKQCVVIRRDVYEVIELEEGKKIKLNGYEEKGYTTIETDDDMVEIDGEKISKSTIKEALKDWINK